MAKFHPLKIKELKRETKDAVSITFAIPKNLKTDFNFIAGQYITLKTKLNDKEIRRGYSICSSPKDLDITIAIKKVKGGNFSVYATTKLTNDVVFDVSKPEGNFTLKTDNTNHKNYLAFAAGSGITPIMAMIKDVLITEPNSTFTLIFGNKTQEETLFFEELESLKKRYSQLKIQYLFSKEQPKDSLFGRIDASIVNYILKKYALKFDEVYLCGPEPMILTIKKPLLTKNFDKKNIHFELFTKKHTKEENMKLDGETKITVLLDDEKTTFTMKQSDKILNAALDKDLDAPYSCQGGICSSCMAKVVEGKAVMDTNNILSDEEVAEGYILTCEAHPVTKKIIVDYDI